jgi:hypothetical protein
VTRATLDVAAARKVLARCNSYSRVDTLIDLGWQMQPEHWHTVVGEEWSMCDNIGRYRLELKKMLPTEGPVVEMMTPDELSAYAALPESLTVYRGCGANNMLGASWSTSREVAAKFPTLNRYRQVRPLVVTARVPRRKVLAVKLDRDEFEIITFSARRISVESLGGAA